MVAAFLVRVRTACREERVQVRRSALQDAEELGWGFPRIVAELEDLEVADFERRARSTTRPDDTMWVFCPEAGAITLWIRLIERSGIVVVSFHEK
jgi:hypothetical protein